MVKWMIIIDAIIFHTSITVIQYGTRYGPRQEAFTRAIFYGERIQMTGFCIQEFIISGLLRMENDRAAEDHLQAKHPSHHPRAIPDQRLHHCHGHRFAGARIHRPLHSRTRL